MKKAPFWMALLSAVVLLTGTVHAAEPEKEVRQAAAYLQAQGIMIGDASGDMMLEDGLTRAQLAALLTRLYGEDDMDPGLYVWACYFTDVSPWAKPYVGYCTAMLLMKGYSSTIFAPDDPVTPGMACTVILRSCGHADGEGHIWQYDTACDYAVSLGLLDVSTTRDSTITRGDMAVLIYRALQASNDGEASREPQPGKDMATPDGDVAVTQYAWSREDFSQQANSAAFTGVYTRELYNTFRQTIVDVGAESDTSGPYAYTMVGTADYSAVKNLMGRLDGVLRYEHYVPGNLSNYYAYPDYFAVSASMPDNYREACAFIRPIVEMACGMTTDREKVTFLNDYLCTLLRYDAYAVSGIAQTFSAHDQELPAACGSYARAMSFLCAAVDIPCMTIRSEDHAWNLVYADGAWLHVDTANNDVSADKHNLLLSETSLNYQDKEPEMTAFIKELLVPGSM